MTAIFGKVKLTNDDMARGIELFQFLEWLHQESWSPIDADDTERNRVVERYVKYLRRERMGRP